MKFSTKLNSILEASNKKLAWGTKGTWELIFGGYDSKDTWDLIPIDKNIFPINIQYESIFGHITSIFELNNLIKNQNKNSAPISTFKNFERKFLSMPGGSGTFVVLKGQPLFGSDSDLSSIPDKTGQRRFINSSQFTSDYRFVDTENNIKDFLTDIEDKDLDKFIKINLSIKEDILKKELPNIKKIIPALKKKKKADKTYDKYDFEISNDPIDSPFIKDFEYFNIINKVLPKTPNFEFNKAPYSMVQFNKLKSKMVSKYFSEIKKQSSIFWKDKQELLTKILLPKKEGFLTTAISDWNEFLISNYVIEKIYFYDFIKYFTDKRQDVTLLKEALELLLKFLKNNNLKSKIIIEDFSQFPAKVATIKKIKNMQDEIILLIDNIKKEYGDKILSKSAFEQEIKSEFNKIKEAQIKIAN